MAREGGETGEVDRRPQKAVIIMGSKSDAIFVEEIEKELTRFGVEFDTVDCSAHKQTRRLLDILDGYNQSEFQIIYVTVAGKTDALSGTVAANVIAPVKSCPPPWDAPMGLYFLSSIYNPTNVPNETTLNPKNVAQAVVRDFALSNFELAGKLLEEQRKMHGGV